MIKKVTIFGLLGIVLFGISTPVLATLIPRSHDCCMVCCAEEQQHHKQQTCSTDMVHPETAQNQLSKDTMHPDCPMLASCLPENIPSGFEIQSEAPAFKSKLKHNPSCLTFQFVLSNEATSQLSGHVPRSFFLVHPARDILTTHSVLLI